MDTLEPRACGAHAQSGGMPELAIPLDWGLPSTLAPECVATFEKMGWGSREEWKAAWEAERLTSQPASDAPPLPVAVHAGSSTTRENR